MAKKVKLVIPSYVKDFKCIGGSCEDSCCIGWDIDIDKLTFRKYFRTKDADMKKQFSKHVYMNQACDSEDVDYGRVRIRDNKWCPFLNEHKLCDIYTNLGEDYLSNVCSSYPRVYNVLDDEFEMSLFMSCPEAVRQLMKSSEKIKFIHEDKVLDKYIVHSHTKTKDPEWKDSDIRCLKTLRNRSIEIMQNRQVSIEQRLLELGEYLSHNSSDEFLSFGLETSQNTMFQMAFFKDVIESLNVPMEIHSDVFKRYTIALEEVFKLNERTILAEQSKCYDQSITRILEPFMKDKSYMFEHYLVNYIYQSNFPFTENQSVFDGYLMLVFRYSLLRFYLAGIGLAKGAIKESDVVELIQVYTKTIEHHKTFIIDSLNELKVKEFDTMDFIHKLIVID